MRDLSVVEISNVAGGGVQGALTLGQSASTALGGLAGYVFSLGTGTLGSLVGRVMGGILGAVGGAVLGFVTSDTQAAQWAQSLDAMTIPTAS